MSTAVKVPPRKMVKLRPTQPRKPSHKGHHGRAKVLTPSQFNAALDKCLEMSTFPTRDRLMLLLSHRAGLRAQEIAYLDYADFTDVTGTIVASLHVTKKMGKYGKERDIPMHPDIFEALKDYCIAAQITEGPIFYNRFGEQMSPNAVQKQIAALYRACGFKGASSHSGRRGFITTLARKCGTADASLKDVQLLAGHAALTTTETYIDASPNARKLVMSIAA